MGRDAVHVGEGLVVPKVVPLAMAILIVLLNWPQVVERDLGLLFNLRNRRRTFERSRLLLLYADTALVARCINQVLTHFVRKFDREVVELVKKC